jgi:hypothetical protein
MSPPSASSGGQAQRLLLLGSAQYVAKNGGKREGKFKIFWEVARDRSGSQWWIKKKRRPLGGVLATIMMMHRRTVRAVLSSA